MVFPAPLTPTTATVSPLFILILTFLSEYLLAEGYLKSTFLNSRLSKSSGSLSPETTLDSYSKNSRKFWKYSATDESSENSCAISEVALRTALIDESTTEKPETENASV